MGGDSTKELNCDVAIIGGGPGGSTTGALIKRYNPDLSVHIFEQQVFPREHVGESHLPPISAILEEMGCYAAVEAADFPVKVGATYRWGSSTDFWDFEFMPAEDYVDEPRPRSYTGQATRLAFQVDRAIYDKILLDRAEELGCVVHSPVRVKEVERDADSVTCLKTSDGTRCRAKHYIDATGAAGLLRRVFEVNSDCPTKLQNVAFWNYFSGAEWAMKIGQEGTRVLVLSIGSGWIWYIPIAKDKVSVGFICPAAYYKQSGKSPAEIYDWALAQEPLVSELLSKATSLGEIQATKDWSFVSERLYGENWFIVGEAGGFADPILAAGLTLTHTGARELAYTILALESGDHDPQWLRHHYERNQVNRVRQHIRFADFWYSNNGIFTDLKDYTREIAAEAGLKLNAADAFQWLAAGGFTHDALGQVGIGGLDITATRRIAGNWLGEAHPWEINKYNLFRLNVDGADTLDLPTYREGQIGSVKTYVRGNDRLPLYGMHKVLAEATKTERDINAILEFAVFKFRREAAHYSKKFVMDTAIQTLESMLNEGWLTGKKNPKFHSIQVGAHGDGRIIHKNVSLTNKAERLAKN